MNISLTWIDREIAIDPAAAVWIATGMRAVAHADGRYDPREMALIAALEEKLKASAPTSEHPEMTPADLQDGLMRSLILVAMADGELTESERRVIEQYAAKVRLDAQDVAMRIVALKKYFMDEQIDVKLFHVAVLQVARDMGMDEADVSELAGHIPADEEVQEA